MVTSIREYVQSLYQLLETFQYAKLKGLSKNHTMKIEDKSGWNLSAHFVPALVSFAIAEKMHYDLVVQTKPSQTTGRLDSLHEQCHLVYAAFVQLSRLFGTSSESEAHTSIRHFFRWLTTDMLLLISTRIRILSVYKQLSEVELHISSSNLASQLDRIEKIKTQMQDVTTTHPCLPGIYLHIRAEISILHRLLSAQYHMAKHLFRETILDLHLCQKILDTWYHDASLLFENKSMLYTPKLFYWLSAFYKALLYKSNLYFHKTLLRLDFKHELKTLLEMPELSYLHLIEQFCKNSQCAYFCLVREPDCDLFIEKTQNIAQDYTHKTAPVKQKTTPPVTGVRSWKLVYIHHHSNATDDLNLDKVIADEKRLVEEHWPNIVSLIQYHYKALDQYKKKPIQELDQRLSITYFFTKVEQNIYIVLLYKKIKQCEPLIAEFLNRILNIFQNKRLIQMLNDGNFSRT